VRLRREARPAVEVGRGESVLAWATTSGGEVLAGTRDAVYLAGTRVPWEQVEAADWDRDAEVFRLSEVGRWGEERREHVHALAEPGRFLELVRERVTASVVLQRHVAVSGRRGLRVIARRAPRGNAPVDWFFEYDPGVDPDDAEVRAAADAALQAARDDVGPG
jgi:hypothetical protein